jgi:hypothetical protein
VSHVTVSRFWRDKGKGVTCNGFCGFGRDGKGVTCNGFWGLERAKENVSHVTVSGVWREKRKKCHV